MAWVVDVDYEVDARLDPQRLLTFVSALRPPSAEDLVEPLGATRILRAHIYPAANFERMDQATRFEHRCHYYHYLRWLAATKVGLTPETVVPWAHFDPQHLDQKVQEWLHPAAIWTEG